ncbi:hypothetical protein L3Q82_001165 [Scortum barcoo]|uniref:Uncharacterized protein n=1 Tax=Scortum barcoo TaxID=214431 RepID=A0ACB8WAY5_9TELE|nr:hypothetical protein L3Q82_001165 [Scortum barcoo]
MKRLPYHVTANGLVCTRASDDSVYLCDNTTCPDGSHRKGQRGMEIAVLLLLTLPLTAATPLRPTPRSDTVLPGDTVQASAVRRSEDTQEQHSQALKIIPFHSEDKHLDLDALKHSDTSSSLRMAVKARPRRAPQRGCQFHRENSCQLHILAHTLHDISNTNGKEKSKNANDPQGFGR